MICKCGLEIELIGRDWMSEGGFIRCMSGEKHEPAEPVAAPQGLSNISPEQMTAHGGTINGMPSAPADSTPQKKYVFDNFCEGCANPMDCSIKGRCLIPEANNTRPAPLSAEQFFIDNWTLITGVLLNPEQCEAAVKFAEAYAAAPRTQGNELECKHCGQTIRPAKDSKVRGYWIGTNNYLTCPNNVGQPHEPLAAQPQPAPRPPACPPRIREYIESHKSGYGVISELCQWATLFFTAIPAPLPLAQAADEVLAELSLLNGKFTQKQNALFDKVREFTAIPAQKEEK